MSMMKTKILGLLLGTLIGFSGFMQAQAQLAPGANNTMNRSNSATGGTAFATKSSNHTAADPCPEPKQALAGTPDDLAKIQEDITRFTLCVQRAQLLERLNELARANIDTIDTALNLTASQGIDNSAMLGLIANANNFNGNTPPPIPSVPSNLFSGDEEENRALKNPGVNVAGSSGKTAPDRQSVGDVDWQIREITGSAGKLKAQLIDTSGSIIRVSQGDFLPDEGWTVRSITTTRVEVEKDDQRQPLGWVK